MSRTELELNETDVLIVGGGPAGLAAAIAARQAGFRVTLADVACPPIDKTCGEGIMPDGLSALDRLGVRIPFAHGIPFRGIRFSDFSTSVEAVFPQGYGLGIRRTTLHQILIDRAQEVGVNMLWGSRVTEITRTEALVNGNYIRFRWLVGADGQNSRVRLDSGLQSFKRSIRRRYGFRRHYRVAPWTEFVEVHWARCGQIYVTPVSVLKKSASLS